jgi:hypothetical protein
MNRGAIRIAVVAAWLPVLLVTAAACGTATPVKPPSAPAGQPAVPLATSLTTSAGTWATVLMGGSAAQHNNFWQLFARASAGSKWKLVTPPGTADNGGLILAPAGGQTLIAAFPPSQNLTYTPLIRTGDDGRAWSSLNPLDAAVAGTPDSLASGASDTRILALTGDGTVEQSSNNGTSWTTLTTVRALAATPAGRACGLTGLTAAAYTPSGTPLLAGTCSRPGTAGIFAGSGQAWRAAAPTMPASVAGRAISVLRLQTIGNQTAALLAAGTGPDPALLAAWSADGGVRWTVSPAVRLGGDGAASASFGPGQTAAVSMPGGRSAMIASGRWRLLPALPSGTTTLVPDPGGVTDALAADRSKLTVWQLGRTGVSWAKVQVITVPIEYGSSS